jgi:glycosyltransferase EpsE
MKLVSVIMPVYNSEKSVTLAINSILNQTYRNFEFLICDDKSTDKTTEVVNAIKDDRIKFFRNDNNLGSLLTRNKLFSVAKGDVFVLQDADDFSEPNRIEELVKQLDFNPNVYLYGSNVSHLNEQLKLLSQSNKPLAHQAIFNRLNSSIPIVYASIGFRRETLDIVGGLRPYFKDLGNYDYDWICRVVEKLETQNINAFLYNTVSQKTSNSTTIVNEKKIVGDLFVRVLHQQRMNGEVDMLDAQNFEAIEQFFQKELQLYKDDKGLYFIQRAQGYISVRNWKYTFQFSIKAIMASKYKVKHLRNFLYIFRLFLKSLFVN